ncbi:MAG: DUF2062 domain-containing protein [Deltaproteobacteria bacterium]|nr:DUF2062 domain-containing protein [Deltaproteobacteria bacterium]MBW2117324.1 DUF2062 domain-containing protein [Deltaproteobacteria bacterium]MBW2342736.1 DUF2062 domain-containing protein [Deltaproteobacteria bacterium]
MELRRQIRYYYLKFIRLKGEPHELALGMAIGIFAGMMPIVPFQTALAVTIALFFKSSKITAALGTWVSNPLNWYFLYRYSYKLGDFILGIQEQKEVFRSIIAAMRAGEESMVVVGKILGGGSTFVFALLLGGFVMGIVFAIPAYFIFLKVFRSIRTWRRSRKERRNWRVPDQ